MVRYRATVIIDFPHMATRELAVLPILRDEACGARIAGLRGRRLRPARRKGAATPDSGRAADRTEETSAGKRRER